MAAIIAIDPRRLGAGLAALVVALMAGQGLAAPAMDCTTVNPGCSQIIVDGDPPQTGAFHGYADPSIRKDPTGKRLWMSYSYPHIEDTFGGVHHVIETHLAHSDNDGRTWTFDRTLWPSVAAPMPNGDPAFTSNEVSNIAPFRKKDGARAWASVHTTSRSKLGQMLYANLPQTQTFVLTQARTPLELADGPEQKLGFGVTNPIIHADLLLSKLDPALNGCIVYDEPALMADKGALYLFVQCRWAEKNPATGQFGLNEKKDFVAVLKTDPEGPVTGWKWRFIGKLVVGSDAEALGQGQLSQFDIARKPDGKFVIVTTPGHLEKGPNGEGNMFHVGCVALGVDSIDPPVLRRQDGKPVVLATVTASDVHNLGPGACAYAPESQLGVVITHRDIKGAAGWDVTLYASHLRP